MSTELKAFFVLIGGFITFCLVYAFAVVRGIFATRKLLKGPWMKKLTSSPPPPPVPNAPPSPEPPHKCDPAQWVDYKVHTIHRGTLRYQRCSACGKTRDIIERPKAKPRKKPIKAGVKQSSYIKSKR